LPFAFGDDEDEEEEFDRKTILQPKEKENYCINKDPLKQLNLLPKSY